MKPIGYCIMLMICCLCFGNLYAQTYNNIRVAYFDVGTHDSIPSDFYKRVRANGFNYVLVEYGLDGSMWKNGRYIDTLGGLQKKLEREFGAADRYGLKLIPLFQTSSSSSNHWKNIINDTTQWQMLPSSIDTTIRRAYREKVPTFAPDPSGVLGFDTAFCEVLKLIYRAFKGAKSSSQLSYSNLDYIHFGADEPIANLVLDNELKRVVMAGMCKRDRDWLNKNNLENVGTQNKILALLGSNIQRKVQMIADAGRKYGHTTKAMYYGDMLDPNHLGGTNLLYAFSNLFDTVSSGTTKIKTYTLASSSYVQAIRESSIVVQWNYEKKNAYSDKDEYNTDSTFRYFTHNKLMFLHGNEITHNDDYISENRLHQLMEQAVVGADPKFNNYVRGFVSFHWKSGVLPFNNNLRMYKTMEFLSHILWYNAALQE